MCDDDDDDDDNEDEFGLMETPMLFVRPVMDRKLVEERLSKSKNQKGIAAKKKKERKKSTRRSSNDRARNENDETIRLLLDGLESMRFSVKKRPM